MHKCSPARRGVARLTLLGVVASLSAACANSEITGPIPGVAGMTTVNAAQGWQYFSLAEARSVVLDGPATTSTSWDLGFFATNVALNGGSAGPAGVTGYCVCQNASATPSEILAMTTEGEAADYEGVSLSDVPAQSAFSADVFNTKRWYRYNIAGDNRISPTYDVYLIKRDDAYYKLQITGYYSITNAPRHITFRFQRLVR